MIVERIEVDWAIDYSNPPTLVLYFAAPGPAEKFDLNRLWKEYSVHGGTLYLQRDGFLYHFLYHHPKDQSGYGGFVFNLLTETGVKQVKGPWSSNETAVTEITGIPLIHVYYKIGNETAMYSAGAHVLEVVELLEKLRPDLSIGQVQHSYGMVWEVITPKPTKNEVRVDSVTGFLHPKTGAY